MRLSDIIMLFMFGQKYIVTVTVTAITTNGTAGGNQYTGTGRSMSTTAQQWPFSHIIPPDNKGNIVPCSSVNCNQLIWLKDKKILQT